MFQRQMGRFGQTLDPQPVGESGGCSTANYLWAESHVYFVYEFLLEERRVNFAATVAQQTLHIPFLAKPFERGCKFNLGFPARVNDRATGLQFLYARAGSSS